jgi:hypothetical protein
MDRPEYRLKLTINGRRLNRVIIDQHYRLKHPEMTDELILELVTGLNGEEFPIERSQGDFEYFRAEPVFHQEKPYRLILVLCLSDDFLGVVNAFRVERK